jgi:hypothetical protein
MTFKLSILLSFLCFNALASPSAFVFDDSGSCKGDQSLCDQYNSAAKPHAWTEAEKSQVISLIQTYEQTLPEFMAKVESNAPIKINRLTQGVQWDKTKKQFVGFPYFGDAGSSQMDLTDITFLRDQQIESVYGSTILEHVFLHELSHIYDFSSDNISLKQPFVALTHWITGTTSDGHIYSSGIDIPGYDVNEVTSINVQSRDLIAKGNFFEAAELTRNYGLRFHFPTAYAMTNPIEDFAESISWSYYQKDTSNYLPPKLTDYLKQEIMK